MFLSFCRSEWVGSRLWSSGSIPTAANCALAAVKAKYHLTAVPVIQCKDNKGQNKAKAGMIGLCAKAF